MTTKRSWFRLWIDQRVSKWAHSIAVEWACKDDGAAVTACGVRPYDHGPEGAVGFMPAGDTPRCPDCTAALEQEATDAAA